MLKKSLTGLVAASALAVPLAAVAWADPTPTPTPPALPGTTGQNPAAPEANGQGPLNPPAPGAPGSNGPAPVCVVSATTPTAPQTQGIPAQGAPSTTKWLPVATLQGSVASDLGLPSGTPVKVFCAPAGTPNPQGQPANAEIPGQPNFGQPNPALYPVSNPPLNQPGQ